MLWQLVRVSNDLMLVNIGMEWFLRVFGKIMGETRSPIADRRSIAYPAWSCPLRMCNSSTGVWEFHGGGILECHIIDMQSRNVGY
jgi:hypothetical protein